MKKMYGRARRIRLYVIIALVVCVVAAIFLVFFNSKKENIVKNVDDNVNFRYLVDYFVGKNYSCEMLQKSGGKCYLNVNDKFYQFTRYDNGFEYVLRTNTYILIIKHTSLTGDTIDFRTNNNAVSGYKSREYTCTTKGSIISEFDGCMDSNGEQLELVTYIGVIEQSLENVKEILHASRYNVDELLNNYVWTK